MAFYTFVAFVSDTSLFTLCECVHVCVSQGHIGHGVEPRRVARELVTATVVLGLGCGSGAEYGQGEESVCTSLA